MKTLLQTLFFFFLVTQICFAQPVSPSVSQGGWFWQNPLPQGNALQSVNFISADVGWAVGRGGTVLKTTNGGNNWTIQSNETGYTLHSVSFANENNGCAVGIGEIWNDSLRTSTAFGVILSTANGGTTWTKQTFGPFAMLSGVSFTDANNGWAVGVEWDSLSRGFILHTTNGVTFCSTYLFVPGSSTVCSMNY